MAYVVESIASRIAWCQQQKTQASGQLELEEWHAEEEGLRDALLHRDHTNQYRNCASGVCKRYVMGLQDGRAMIRVAEMGQHQATSRQ